MESLNDALNKRLERAGLSQTMTASFIVETANRILPPQFRAKTFHNHDLLIEINSASDAYFFRQECETYLEQINAALPKPVVEKLRFKMTYR